VRFGVIKAATDDYLVPAINVVDYADVSALKTEAERTSRNLSNFYRTASHLYRRQTPIKIPISTYFYTGTAIDRYEADIWFEHKLDYQLS
jgi:hypothetical protein